MKKDKIGVESKIIVVPVVSESWEGLVTKLRARIGTPARGSRGLLLDQMTGFHEVEFVATMPHGGRARQPECVCEV